MAKWLDKYDAPQAQNGIEGTMGGLTDVGFNYNGAWGGTMQMGGVLPGAVGFTYARTAGAAPANGPYAKKTKASAQNGEEVMKGREFVEKWMNSPMYKQMLEKSAQGPEFERINTGRISNLSVPTNVSTDIHLHGTNTLGQKQHRIRTMFNATVPERDEMIRVLQAAVDNPKDKEAKRRAEEVMQPVITGWNIGMNPILKPGTLDYEATLAHEYGHTTDDRFISKFPHMLSRKELMSQSKDASPYIPKSDIEKMQSYYQGKVNDDLTKYVSKPQETRQYLTSLRYLGKTQGVYDPFTEKITPEQYKRIKPTELNDPAGILRKIYTDEQIIDMLNSISRTQRANGVPVAQNGQEMKYYQEGLDFKPKTISQDGSDIPVDPMGYWNPENVGGPVIIPSNVITMEGVDQPLLGISDTGDVQYMEPGEDYEFDGEYVTEYPVAQKGKTIPAPTTADSLKVYNAAVRMMNYYSNDKRHKKPEINIYDPQIERSRVSDVAYDNLETYRRMYKDLSDPTTHSIIISRYEKDYGLPKQEILKKVGKAIAENKSAAPGTAYYKDAYPSKIDINAPSAYIDYRIAPQGFINYPSSIKKSDQPEPAGSVTGLWYYDPLAIKPYHMRTPKEKIEWEKKYGKKETTKAKPTPPPAKKKVVTPTPEPVKESKVVPVSPEAVRKTILSTVPSRDMEIFGGMGIFGPGNTRIGEYDEKTNTFYPDYENLAGRKKVNQPDIDLLADQEKLSNFITSKTGKKPKINVKQRNGGVNKADEYPIEKLDQLLNFTNYNKPTKGGWLDKYN